MISLYTYCFANLLVVILIVMALWSSEKELKIMKKNDVRPVKYSNMLGLYCVYDKVTKRYGDPVCYANDSAAVRVFRSMCAVPSCSRKDYELFYIGTYYNGKIVSAGVRLVKNGASFKDKELVDTYLVALKGELYDENKPVAPSKPDNLGECLTGPLPVESEVENNDPKY